MGAKMRNGLLSIGLFMAAIALISSEYVPNSARPTTHSSYRITTPTKKRNITTVHSNTTTPHPNTTTVHSNTTTPHHNTTAVALNTTTPHHNTTTVPANTTTPHHNTTTVPANTTTPHPNTTTAPINTTTPHPNTTAVPPTTPHHNSTTTAHTTTPVPQPTQPTNTTVGRYNVTGNNNETCIMADFAIKILVNNSEVNGTFIVQPSKTKFSGNCDEKVANLFLNFVEGEVVLKFRNNATSKMVYVEFMEYDLTYAFKSGALRNYTGKNESLQLFAAAAEHSYSCKSVKVFMGQGVHLDFTNNRIQAFNIKNKEFGKPDLCKADQPDYRIPIAVGIILVILIVIVVIAYLVSRKRRTDGYQSL